MRFGKEPTFRGMKCLEIKKLSQQNWEPQQLGIFNMEKRRLWGYYVAFHFMKEAL